MVVSTRTKYGFSLLIYIARFGDGRNIQLSEISKNEDLSIKYLEKIVQILKRAGFLNVTRGVRGGYRLSRQSSKINLYDIYKVLEGSLVVDEQDNFSGFSFWDELKKYLIKYLESKTLYDLVEIESNNNMFYI